MCGICGAISIDGAPVPRAGVEAMLGALVHRGPDASGILEAPGVAAGIRRLRVVDLETGDQPIASEDGSVEVVFNGEIYNHREIRKKLGSVGHRFRTRSDTEVLVHLWEDEGPGMLGHLDGMYAFCLVDRRRREVFLARDPLGIKPLYLAANGATLLFASETAALRRGPGARLEVDPDRLLDLLALQFVPGEATLFRGVTKLPPGAFLHVRDGRAERGRHWRLPPPAAVERGDEAEAARSLLSLLRDAVRRQREADVPVGVFLSGGLDSTAIAWLLATETAGRVASFSVGFEGEGAFDERPFARLAAEHAGTDHHEIVVSADDVARLLPEAVAHLEEPVLDPAFLPTWILARFARETVTVVLTGEGADELFGGYRRYALAERHAWARAIPGLSSVARTAARARAIPHRWAQALEALGTREPALEHFLWALTFSPAIAEEILDPESWSRFETRAEAAFAPYFEHAEGLDARLRADLSEWLPHDLLAKVDGATMAHSLEARVPFLDVALVERVSAWPAEFKVRGGGTKRLLRKAFADVLPREILEREKRGFDLPLDAWLRGPLRKTAEETLLEGSGLARWPGLSRDRVRALLGDHLAGSRDLGLPLFNLLSIGLFLERHG